MKITKRAETVSLNNVVDISVDVHKDTLCYFFRIDGSEYADSSSNRTQIIEKKLQKYKEIATTSGRANLRIICEPTGQYHNKLLRSARRLGCFTSFVNAEAVAKFRIIETNDYNKTDQKDPKVILSLGRLNKLVQHRVIKDEYMVLRKLHKMYQDCDIEITRVRCKISRLLVELFCDFSFKKDFIYSTSGQALVLEYFANPYTIVQHGYQKFASTMKKRVPYIRGATLERLWDDALQSVRNCLPSAYIDVLEDHLRLLMVDFHRVMKRKRELTEKMKAILDRLRETDPFIPPPTPGFISDKNLARLLAETGPLADFVSANQLMRYAGLNLKTRQSGQYKGQDRISKKGRPLLRKVLLAIALPLVRKGQLYGEYYHRKRQLHKMPGNKAMTVVARQLLRKIYGWCRSGEAFDRERFFICQTRYERSLRQVA